MVVAGLIAVGGAWLGVGLVTGCGEGRLRVLGLSMSMMPGRWMLSAVSVLLLARAWTCLLLLLRCLVRMQWCLRLCSLAVSLWMFMRRLARIVIPG